MTPRVLRLFVQNTGEHSAAPGETAVPYINIAAVDGQNGDHLSAGGHISMAIRGAVSGVLSDLPSGKAIKVTIEDDDTSS